MRVNWHGKDYAPWHFALMTHDSWPKIEKYTVVAKGHSCHFPPPSPPSHGPKSSYHSQRASTVGGFTNLLNGNERNGKEGSKQQNIKPMDLCHLDKSPLQSWIPSHPLVDAKAPGRHGRSLVIISSAGSCQPKGDRISLRQHDHHYTTEGKKPIALARTLPFSAWALVYTGALAPATVFIHTHIYIRIYIYIYFFFFSIRVWYDSANWTCKHLTVRNRLLVALQS